MTTQILPVTTAPRPPQRRVLPWRAILKHIGLVLLAVTMIYPLIWMLTGSFEPTYAIFRDMGLIPSELTLDNYTNGWNALADPFSVYILNSLLICVGSILGNLISCSLAAYAFARMRFRGRNVFFAMMLLTLMLPSQVTVVPQYILFKSFGWIDTLWPLIVPKFLAVDAFFIFLMVQFIRGLPRELDEAARMDGAGHWTTFTRILLPLMTPALATTTIFTFIWTWNDFYTPLLYLADENMTVTLALRRFMDSEGLSDYGGMFAMSMISLLPLFLIFTFGQRWLIRGIATTGIK